MKHEMTITAVLVDEQATYTIRELSQRLNISQLLLNDMEKHGLFETKTANKIDHKAVNRIETACRLLRDLEVNVQGAILAVELMDKIEDLHERLAFIERS